MNADYLVHEICNFTHGPKSQIMSENPRLWSVIWGYFSNSCRAQVFFFILDLLSLEK